MPLNYVHSFHQDYVSIRSILAYTATSESYPKPLRAGRQAAALGYARAKHFEPGALFRKRKIKLSLAARKRLRRLLHRIGLTNCRCIIPDVRYVVDSQSMRNKSIPIFELHCPKVRGASATYVESKSGARDFQVTLSFFGTGTDSVSSFDEKTTDGISVKDGTCCKIVRKARFNVTGIRYVCAKCKSTTASRLLFDLIPGADELIPLVLRQRKDGCNKSPHKLKSNECQTIRLPKNVTKRRTIIVTNGSRTESTFGLTISGINVGGTVKVETLRDIHHEYVLRGPRTYYHYPLTGVNRFWTTSRY